jgi:hypothetical protein
VRALNHHKERVFRHPPHAPHLSSPQSVFSAYAWEALCDAAEVAFTPSITDSATDGPIPPLATGEKEIFAFFCHQQPAGGFGYRLKG